MGFKRRKVYTARGWIPKRERSIDEMRLNAYLDRSPAEDLLILDEHDLEDGVNYRRVKATATIEVEGEE